MGTSPPLPWSGTAAYKQQDWFAARRQGWEGTEHELVHQTRTRPCRMYPPLILFMFHKELCLLFLELTCVVIGL